MSDEAFAVLLLGQAKEDRAENPHQVYAPSAMRPLQWYCWVSRSKKTAQAKHKVQAEAIWVG
jgi:hypothetical protein